MHEKPGRRAFAALIEHKENEIACARDVTSIAKHTTTNSGALPVTVCMMKPRLGHELDTPSRSMPSVCPLGTTNDNT